MRRRALFAWPVLQSAAVKNIRGAILVHEHILVDFIGADQVSPTRYQRPT